MVGIKEILARGKGIGLLLGENRSRVRCGKCAVVAQLVEHVIGNDEVSSSILLNGSKKYTAIDGGIFYGNRYFGEKVL